MPIILIALNGTIPCHPNGSPTFVPGMRQQPVKVTG